MSQHRSDSVRHAAFLLIGSGFLALAVSAALDPLWLILIVPLLVRAYRARVAGDEAARASGARMVGAIAMIAVLLAIAGRQLLPLLVTLATWAGLALVYRPESERNYYQSFLVALLQLVVSGATTDSIVFGISILLFIVSGTLALAAMTLRGERGGLAGRFAERAAVADPTPVPVVQNGAWEAEALLLRRLATLVTGIIVASTIVLFFVIPRYGAGYFFAREEETVRHTAFSDTVDFGAIGKIQKSAGVAMRVELTNVKGPYPGILRWRGVGLGHFDGTSWRATKGRSYVLHDVQKGFRETNVLVNAPFGRAGRALQQKVFLAKDSGVLFGATRVHRVWAKLSKVEKTAEDALVAQFPAYSAKHYTVTSDVGRPSPDALRKTMGGTYPFDIRDRYTQLPPMDPRVAQLARTIVGDAKTHYDMATKLQNYLMATYRYDMPDDIEKAPEKPIEDFLLRTKKGHCEYFAGSLAVLARSLGIPARVVNGYAQGSYSRIGGYYVVTDADAHSWVEIFFPFVGWIDFDATPPSALAREDGQSTVDLYWDAVVMAWRRYVIDYHLLDQIEYVKSVAQMVRPQRGQQPRDAAGTSSTRQLPPVVAFVLAVAFVLMFLVRRLTAQAHAHAEGRSLGEAAFYPEMLALLAKRELRPRDGQTPKEFARAVAAAWPEAASAVDGLTAQYEKARFAELAPDRATVAAAMDALAALSRSSAGPSASRGSR